MRIALIACVAVALTACGPHQPGVKSSGDTAQLIAEVTSTAYDALLDGFNSQGGEGMLSGHCTRGGDINVPVSSDSTSTRTATLTGCTNGINTFDGVMHVKLSSTNGVLTLNYDGTLSTSGRATTQLTFQASFTEQVEFDAGDEEHSFKMTLDGTVGSDDSGGKQTWPFSMSKFHYDGHTRTATATP
jgi:hypothetical protein